MDPVDIIRPGEYKVLFVGAHGTASIRVDRVIFDANGRPIYIITTDEVIYNWSTIIGLTLIKESK